MQIDNRYTGLSAYTTSSSSKRNNETDFPGLGAVSQSDSEKSSSGAKIQTQEEKAAAAQAAHEALWAQFKEYMEKTPAELMREQVLKDLGISEEDLAAMPPEKRAAMEDEIADRIKEKLLGKKQEGADEVRPTLSSGTSDATQAQLKSYMQSQTPSFPLLETGLKA